MATLTNTGEQLVIDALISVYGFFVGWGTGATADAKTDTGLQTPSAEARVVPTETDNGDNVDYIATITSASSQTITEVAMFDASTAGNCFMRHVHGGVALGIGDAIQYTINYEQT